MELPGLKEEGKVEVVVVVAMVVAEGAGVVVIVAVREVEKVEPARVGLGVAEDADSRKGVGVTRMRREQEVMIRRWSGWGEV